MLSPSPLPGLFITGTDTGVGKTVVAGAIGRWFMQQGRRVAISKPAATGCVHRREGLVSEDAEFLAHAADARHPLDLICPQRYAEPLAPAVAAQREGRPLDWSAIDRSIRLMCATSDVLVVEGVGGILTPMDEKHSVLDMAAWLQLPAVVVARPSLGTINHTLLTLHALRARNVGIAGVVINRYPTDTPPSAEETNPKAIEKWGKVPVLCVLPDMPTPVQMLETPVHADLMAVLGSVDWSRLMNINLSD